MGGVKLGRPILHPQMERRPRARLPKIQRRVQTSFEKRIGSRVHRHEGEKLRHDQIFQVETNSYN